METGVTLTFKEGNCQCIAQEAVLRYLNLGGHNIEQQHTSEVIFDTFPNFS
jgi:hypothetical protein